MKNRLHVSIKSDSPHLIFNYSRLEIRVLFYLHLFYDILIHLLVYYSFPLLTETDKTNHIWITSAADVRMTDVS